MKQSRKYRRYGIGGEKSQQKYLASLDECQLIELECRRYLGSHLQVNGGTINCNIKHRFDSMIKKAVVDRDVSTLKQIRDSLKYR